MRYQVAVRFVIEGDLRFISHHDTMRLFERALSRARLPVRFSEGFNPRPRLSLPAARPVGVASEADILVVELSEPVAPAIFLNRLARQMPAGLTLTEAWALDEKSRLRVDGVEYALAIEPENAAAVAEAVHGLLAAGTWRVQRRDRGNKPAKTIDVRAYLADASVRQNVLRWTVRLTDEGSVRPAEFLSAVGLGPDQWQHRVRRTAVHWRRPTPARASADQLRAGPA